MKKLIYCAAALAAMIFAGSCQQENLEPVAQESTVTFSVELPGVQTKAIGDGFNVDQLVYEVWKTENPNVTDLLDPAQKATRLYQETAKLERIDDEQKTIITLNLVHDQNYTILFWAQNSQAVDVDGKKVPAYVTDDLTNVRYAKEVTAEKSYLSNNENMAAFYKAEFLTAEEIERPNGIRRTELKRPFAQLNIGTKNTAEEYVITMNNSKVKITNVPKTFNVANSTTGTAASPAFVFDYDTVPNKTESLRVNGDEYEYVAMNYIFANGNVEVEYWIDATLTATDPTEGRNETTNAIIYNKVTQVPLMENYRTNIVGNLLTSTTKYEVVIDADFETPEYVRGDEWSQNGNYNYTINANASEGTLKAVLEHADAAAKAAATKAAGPEVKITLNGDVEWETGAGIGSTPLLPAESLISKVIIEGNDKTFTATGKGVGQIRLANGALLTFNKVKVVDHSVSYAENSWEYGYLEFGGNLVFNECQFVNAIMMESENAAFTNCSFNSNKDNEYAVWVNEGKTTFNGCTFTGARGLKVHEAYGSEVASVVVNGCTFGPLTKKPGIALGDLNAQTSVTIQNSTFDGCQAGDQKLYMYETDTDVTTFTFVTENNIVVPSGDEVIEQGEGVVMVATAAGFAKAIEEAEAGDVILVAGSVVLPSGVITSTPGALTIEGYTEDAEVAFSSTAGGADGGLNCYADGMDLLFKNITVVSPNTGSAYSGGFGRAKSVTFENCEYIGQYRAVNAYTKFIECTIDPQTSYIYTDYADVDFTDCTFNCSEGKGVQVYNDGNTTNTVINVTDCTFTAAKQGATWDGKPVTAIDINSNGEVFTVNITNTTATGFPEGLATASTLFNIKGGANYATVLIDGNKFISNGLYEDQQGNAIVSSQAGLTAAIEAGKLKIALTEGTYSLPEVPAGLKLVGLDDDVVLDMKGKTPAVNGEISIENVTIEFSNENYKGFQHTSTEYYKNCTIIGQPFLYGNDVTFETCIFKQTSSDWYNVWTYGAKKVNFNTCKFYSAGKSVLVYQESNTFESNVTLNNCELHASAPVEGKAAVEIDASLVTKYVVKINDTEANGFAAGSISKSTLWNIKKGAEKAEVYVNDTRMIADGVVLNDDGEYELNAVNGLFWFADQVNVAKNNFSGKTVKLAAHIDLTGIDWEPISQTRATQFRGTFDGQNKTISNLTIDTTDKGGEYASGLFGWILAATVKNVNIDTANISAQHYVGAIAGYLEWSGCTVENCHVSNATIVAQHNSASCGNKVGGIVGYAGNAETYVKTCTVSNSTIVADRDAGQVVGAAKATNVVDCSANNVTVSAAEGCTDEDAGKNIRNEVIGRVL